MAYIEVLQGPQVGPIELERTLTIGRSEKSDLVLPEANVSRDHARVVKDGDAFFIEDSDSKHGTLLNGAAVNGRKKLIDNDVVSICGNLLKFLEGEPQTDRQDQSAVIMSTLDATLKPEAISDVAAGLKLRAVLEIIRCLGSTLQVDEFLPKILETLLDIFPQAERGTILLWEGTTLVPKATRSRSSVDADVKISQTIVTQALEQKQAILSSDALSDELFDGSPSISDFRIRSFVCVPLLTQDGDPIGILQIQSEKSGRPFKQDDMDLLVSVASTTAMALENLSLQEDAIANERIQRELELARDVQERFLPARLPQIQGYRFSAWYNSAQSVGGDYYGFIDLPENRLAISVGDVSGKGMPAAMLMARLSSDVRYSLLAAADPGLALQWIHRSIGETEMGDKFVTLVLLVLDKSQHLLSIANAGHIPPVIKHRDGTIEELGAECAGFPLTVSPDPNYEYKTVTAAMEPGSTVVACTDGVIEARNPQSELFSIERLHSHLRTASTDPKELGQSIIDSVSRFAAGRPPQDDTTLVCFGRLE